MAGVYVVTAPYVTVDQGDAVRGFYAGASFEAEDDAVAHLLRKGMVVEATEPEPEPESEPAGQTPAKSASKADWVAYATDEARGEDRLSEEEADALTRDELAAKYKA